MRLALESGSDGSAPLSEGHRPPHRMTEPISTFDPSLASGVSDPSDGLGLCNYFAVEDRSHSAGFQVVVQRPIEESFSEASMLRSDR